ncbi:hypothetical protein, partial [Pseudoleptotrichia goodfellowii]|uniref:hypothetical protein n=1 Tax=Pseudoleptotrichia goodfellowii TaxID=157692 RepID=UPI001CA5206F
NIKISIEKNPKKWYYLVVKELERREGRRKDDEKNCSFNKWRRLSRDEYCCESCCENSYD